MNFFDPSRPRVSGLPAFAPNQPSAGLSIIPALYCAPRNNGQDIELSAFFSKGHNRSSRCEVTIPATEFPAFWEKWLANPEQVAEDVFGWTLSPEPIVPSLPILSFDDLLERLE
jgi:hypothetical protein